MSKRIRYKDIDIELNIDEIIAKVNGDLDVAMFTAGNEILDVATPKTPYRTGKLRDSGYVSTVAHSSYNGGKGHRREIKPDKQGIAVISFSWFTARFFELGTRRLSARPYLRPAFDEAKGQARDTIVRIVKEALEKA